ncbi:MAG: hypothetical protein ISR44_11045, partial [Rhodospirillales bacterium]|nr:hypothetical protein [Rhodospirillales bacterium]
MRRYLPALVLALPLIFGPTPLNAWDTGLNEKAPWKGIYKHGGRAPRDGPGLSQFTTGKNRNEHTEMANATLHKMGAATAFAMESMEPLSITDLNASLLRRDLKASGSRIGLEDRGTFEDNPATALEERSFPAPPHFAGIPDFSYTIYDWVSKNVLCPPLPVGAPYRRRCHSYAHWHGAALNASHFGTQAGDMYVHIHRVALNLAGRARDMRQRLERSDAPGDLTAHRDFVREAELMALAYEGYAQHFLQDRWSMGHMWERWNAGGYD